MTEPEFFARLSALQTGLDVKMKAEISRSAVEQGKIRTAHRGDVEALRKAFFDANGCAPKQPRR